MTGQLALASELLWVALQELYGTQMRWSHAVLLLGLLGLSFLAIVGV